jgi:hypothetical protein
MFLVIKPYIMNQRMIKFGFFYHKVVHLLKVLGEEPSKYYFLH